MAQYWSIKDKQGDDSKTVKPWEEMVSHGDLVFPEPKPTTGVLNSAPTEHTPNSSPETVIER